ncbi:MAG: pyruvate kinase, partial [Xanthobacteraceae bacterium]
MRRLRRCKIVATLGPATAQRSAIADLFRAGADVFRINMSHAGHDDMRARVNMIRSLEQEFSRPIAIMLDLQGPKLRIGGFKNGSVHLKRGAHFVFDQDSTPGDATRVHLPHPEILGALQPGHVVLIDDGKVRLHVVEAYPKKAVAVVDVSGTISNRKGLSLPDTEIPLSSMTEK